MLTETNTLKTLNTGKLRGADKEEQAAEEFLRIETTVRAELNLRKPNIIAISSLR